VPDETANVAPLPNLNEIASTAPGQGVQLLSVFRNLSQVADRFGRERAETIIANHRARLIGSAIGDRATLEYLGAVLGEEQIQRVATHRQRLEIDLGSRTYSHGFERLATPNRIREANVGTALLVYGNLPPAWVTPRSWHRDRRLKELVNGAQANHLTPARPPAPAPQQAPSPEPAPAPESAT
jgi:type IV secretion system protein VirD4